MLDYFTLNIFSPFNGTYNNCKTNLTINLVLKMYLALPCVSLTSFARSKWRSKRNTRLSRHFLIICRRSHTWKESCSTTSPRLSIGTSHPSRFDKCIASLAFFGTDSITSKPSCEQFTLNIMIDLQTIIIAVYTKAAGYTKKKTHKYILGPIASHQLTTYKVMER